MKLNRKDKNKLRQIVRKKLRDVEQNHSVKLEKEILEELLFDEMAIGKTLKVKLPVWSGAFLRKLDLSEVDFTGVSWHILTRSMEKKYPRFYRDYNLKKYEKELDKIKEEINNSIKQDGTNSDYIPYMIDYSNTNAVIDLTKSFDALHGKRIYIDSCFFNCDFSQLDLTDIDILGIFNSSLENTGLKIPSDTKLFASCSNLGQIDLSSRNIDGYQYLNGNIAHLADCDLTNTGINIKIDKDTFKDVESETIDLLGNVMEHEWDGCYINDKLNTPAKSSIRKNKLLEEYKIMRNDIFETVIGKIDEQVKISI